MSDFKAIETKYKGYRFRSRLEARWAIFFDALGIEWQYEKDGYVLPSGPYLPDFWIPVGYTHWAGAGWFIEIKGEDPSAEEIKKASELAVHSGHHVKIECGVPGDHFEIFCFRDGKVDDSRKKRQSEAGWCPDAFEFVREETKQEASIALLDHFSHGYIQQGNGTDPRDAAVAARSARFEHGETPT